MNIALFIRSFYGGGAERVVINLANELSKTNQVHILVAEDSGHHKNLVSSSIKITQLKKSSIKNIALELPTIHKELKFDVLISNLIHENIFSSIGWLRSGRKFSLIKIEHNKIEREMRVGSNFKYLITKILSELTKNIGSKTIGVSKGVTNDLRLKGVKHVDTIYNPIINEKSIHSKKTTTNETKDFKILFVGRLVQQKNPMLAVQTIEHLLKNNKNYTLTIAGEGPLENQLHEYIKSHHLTNNVKVVGFVKNITNLYRQHQYLLLTSKFEGFGNVLVEAAYNGCAPISLDIDFGPSEIINDPRIGILLPSNSKAIDIAKKIEQRNSKIDLNWAKKDLVHRFGIRRITQEYESLIHETW